MGDYRTTAQMLRRLDGKVDWWIFSAYSVPAASLACYRVLFVLYTCIFLVPGREFRTLGSLPDVTFSPPIGPMQLLSGFPSTYFFDGLILLLYVSLAALLVGYRTRLASLSVGLLLFTGYGFLYSLGKIDHNILYLLVPVVMAFSGWGSAHSYDAHRRVGRSDRVEIWPIALMALFVGFGMFTAGVPKIKAGWLDPSTQAVQGILTDSLLRSGMADLLAPVLYRVDSMIFWESLDYLTVMLEVGFIVAIIHPASLRVISSVALLFHLGVLLMLNIKFTAQPIIYALFFDLTATAAWFHRRQLERLVAIPASWRAPLLVIPLLAVLLYGVSSLTRLGTLPYGAPVKDVVALFGAAILAVFYLVRSGRRLFRNGALAGMRWTRQPAGQKV